MTGQTLLHRQIHPDFFKNGHLQSSAFKPFSKDAGLLSTDDGDRITAAAAYIRYTTVRHLSSVGSMAITPDECSGQALPIRPDGDGNSDLDDEHVSIDFNGLNRKQVEAKSKNLRDVAIARDWTHRP
jgi:hypothetical protein